MSRELHWFSPLARSKAHRRPGTSPTNAHLYIIFAPCDLSSPHTTVMELARERDESLAHTERSRLSRNVNTELRPPMDIKKERHRRNNPGRKDANSTNNRPTNFGKRKGKKIHRDSAILQAHAHKGGRSPSRSREDPHVIIQRSRTVGAPPSQGYATSFVGGYLNDPNTVSPLSRVHEIPRQPFRRFRARAQLSAVHRKKLPDASG